VVVQTRTVGGETRRATGTHSLWSDAQHPHVAADVGGVEWPDGVNPPSGRPDLRRRSPRLAHRPRIAAGPAPTTRELGAALIEAAYVIPVFFLLVFGIMEIGLYMNDDLAVGHTVRSGSRMASASGNDVMADYGVIMAVKKEIAALDEDAIESIVVYKANNVGEDPTLACQSASVSGLCNHYTVADFAVPRDRWGCLAGVSPDRHWCPNIRDVTRSDGPAPGDNFGTDFVGVWIKYEHDWVTKIFADTSQITDSSVIRLEPRER
jgi:Flp pilus assembly protein TadG